MRKVKGVGVTPEVPGDPFLYVYADPSGNFDTVFAWSQSCGSTARDIILIALHPNITAFSQNPKMYELGSRTVSDVTYEAIKGFDAITKGQLLKDVFGTGGATVGTFLKTIPTGPTPGAWIFIIFGVDIADRASE